MTRRRHRYTEGDWDRSKQPRGFRLRALGALVFAVIMYVGFATLDADVEKDTLLGVVASGLAAYFVGELLWSVSRALRKGARARHSRDRRSHSGAAR